MAFAHRSRFSFAFSPSFPRLSRRPLLVSLRCKGPHRSCVMDVFHMLHTHFPIVHNLQQQRPLSKQVLLNSSAASLKCIRHLLSVHTHTHNFYVCQPSKVSIHLETADFHVSYCQLLNNKLMQHEFTHAVKSEDMMCFAGLTVLVVKWRRIVHFY